MDAVAWARDLVNIPAGDLPPAALAEAAEGMADEVGLECRVWDESELEEGGFGGILGVGQGSIHPPRLIELRYAGGGKSVPLAFTGKGITFDSGGLSIKPADGMETMKDDMGGAASILATMKAIARLKPKVNVIAAIPCSENMPSGSAQKPGDVIRHYGGTTSEVLNTDAEGRLVLADALAFLAEKGPRVIVDTATLTGACMVALGTDITGAMGNDDATARDLIRAGAAVGEPVWQLPLHPDYRKLDRLQRRRHQEHREALRRRHHRRLVPRRVRGRHALGPPRYRRTGVLRWARPRAQGRHRGSRPHLGPLHPRPR